MFIYKIYSWVCCYQEKWTLVPDPKQNLKTNCPIYPNIQDFGQYFHGWPTLIRIVMPEKRIFGRITNSHSSKIIPQIWCIQEDVLKDYLLHNIPRNLTNKRSPISFPKMWELAELNFKCTFFSNLYNYKFKRSELIDSRKSAKDKLDLDADL